MGLLSVAHVPLRPERANTLTNRIQEYLNEELAHWAPEGKYGLRYVFRRFEIYFASRPFTRNEVRQFYVWLRENHTLDTYNRTLRFGKMFIKWLVKMEYIDDPIHLYLPSALPAPVKEIILVSDEEYQRFMRSHQDSVYGWMMVLSYHTSFRLKDACHLAWAEVDMNEQVIRKMPSKTRRRGVMVEVPILSGSDLHTWLIKLSADRDDPVWVCPELVRRYRTHRGLSAHFTYQLRKSGITKATFHSLRRTFESHLANSGVNMALAAKITGRTDTRSLMAYVKPDPDVVREAVANALELPDKVVSCSSPPILATHPAAPSIHSGEPEAGASGELLPVSHLI